MATKVETQPKQVSQLDKDIAAAKAAAKQRQVAPRLSVTSKEIPHKSLIATFAPECVGRDAKWHPYTDEPKNHSRNISRGYIPVVDPNTDRQVVGEGGDLLYKLPIDIHQRNLEEVVARSNRIAGKVKDDTDSHSAITETVEVITTDAKNYESAVKEADLATAD